MKKITYTQVDLKCIFQQVDDITRNQYLCGIISRQSEGNFRFEESVRRGSPTRNPKLFDGTHISMVRMQNGKIQFHMKTLSDGFDREKLPYDICHEIITALKILD